MQTKRALAPSCVGIMLPAVAIVFAFLAASGCSWSRDSVAGGTEARIESLTGRRADHVERNASIYAAVIRELVTRDRTLGSDDSGLRVVFVLDGAVPGAANPNLVGHARKPEQPFTYALKRKLEKKLSDLPPLRFVQTRRAAIRIESSSSPGEVIPGGVLISLGPVIGGSNRVRVGNSLWLSGKAGLWLTYVVTRRANGWQIKGTTGPMTIS
jgi:hypothetical protein